MEKSEERIQYEIVEWFQNNYCRIGCNPKCVIMSVPNDGKDLKEQMRKISTGLKRGASDLIVLLPNIALFVEVKTEVGRQSEAQKHFESDVTALGFEYWLVRSLSDFQTKLKTTVKRLNIVPIE